MDVADQNAPGCLVDPGKDFGKSGQVCGYVDRFFYITQSLWAIWAVIMAIALVVLGMLVVSRSAREASRGAAEAAVGIVAIQAALWIALICIFALPLLRQATLQRISVCSLDNLFFFFAGAAAWSFGVGLVAFAIYASRWLLARAPFLTLERKAQLTPRMLFGGPIIFAIIAGVGVNVVIFFGQYLNLFGGTNMVLEGLSGMFGFSGKAGWLQDAVINHRPKIYAATSALAVGAGVLMAGGFTHGHPYRARSHRPPVQSQARLFVLSSSPARTTWRDRETPSPAPARASQCRDAGADLQREV